MGEGFEIKMSADTQPQKQNQVKEPNPNTSAETTKVSINNNDNNDNEISQDINIGGKIYTMKGTVDISLTPKKDEPEVPEPDNPDVKPTEGTILHGGWGANMDPKSWVRTVMRNPSTQFKVVDENGKNVATNFTTPQNADNFIKYFQRYPDRISELNVTDPDGPDGGGSGNGGGPGGPVTPDLPGEVAGVKFPVQTTGKKRVDDYHYNPNDGLRIDFQDNPKDGSYINSALAVYGTFVDEPTAKEDRCVKWSWANHTGSGTRVNTYIVNIRNSDGAPRMRFEEDHPNGYHTLLDWQEDKKGTPAKKGQLWSLMGIRRNVLDKDGKPVAVKLEVYEDQGIVDNKPGNKWVKLAEHTDTKYKIFDYKNGMEVTGRFDDSKGDKNIKIHKAVLIETGPIKQTA